MAWIKNESKQIEWHVHGEIDLPTDRSNDSQKRTKRISIRSL